MTLLGLSFFESSWLDSLFRNAPEHIYTYTGFFSAFILMAVANAFNVRSDSWRLLQNIEQNTAFIKVMLLIVVVQVAMTSVGGSLLRTAPLNWQEWLVVVACAGLAFAWGMLYKLIRTK